MRAQEVALHEAQAAHAALRADQRSMQRALQDARARMVELVESRAQLRSQLDVARAQGRRVAAVGGGRLFHLEEEESAARQEEVHHLHARIAELEAALHAAHHGSARPDADGGGGMCGGVSRTVHFPSADACPEHGMAAAEPVCPEDAVPCHRPTSSDAAKPGGERSADAEAHVCAATLRVAELETEVEHARAACRDAAAAHAVEMEAAARATEAVQGQLATAHERMGALVQELERTALGMQVRCAHLGVLLGGRDREALARMLVAALGTSGEELISSDTSHPLRRFVRRHGTRSWHGCAAPCTLLRTAFARCWGKWASRRRLPRQTAPARQRAMTPACSPSSSTM